MTTTALIIYLAIVAGTVATIAILIVALMSAERVTCPECGGKTRTLHYGNNVFTICSRCGYVYRLPVKG